MAYNGEIINVGTPGHIDHGKAGSGNGELLPCPFCGGTDIDLAMASGYKGGDKDRPTIAAGCYTCGAVSGDVLVPKNGSGHKEAAKVWNTRTS